jgi:hypothetical protein
VFDSAATGDVPDDVWLPSLGINLTCPFLHRAVSFTGHMAVASALTIIIITIIIIATN